MDKKLLFLRREVDPRLVFAYNSGYEERKIGIACHGEHIADPPLRGDGLVYLSNSLKNGAASASQSQAVTEGIQDAIGVIAPSSPVAKAEGTAFDRLHAFVRKSAHFLEYALLGALLLFTCRSYTRLKRFWFAPPCIAFLVGAFDEYIQNFTPGRGNSFADVLIDTAGAAAGILFAVFCLFVAFLIGRRRRKKVSARATAPEQA